MHRSRPTSSRLTAMFAVALRRCPCTPRSRPRARAAKPAFSIDDALNVVSYVQTDLSDDGRWLATVSTIRRDKFGVDYRRDGDPTYIRPAAGTVLVIETATGKSRAIFPDKRNVKSLAWSPDGSRLAMLVLHNDAFEPVIWERATGKVDDRSGTGRLVRSGEQRRPLDERRCVHRVRAPFRRLEALDSRAVRSLHEGPGVRSVEQRPVPRVG